MLPHANRALLLALLLLLPPLVGAETYFEAAERLLESGQITEARRALRLELRLRPRNLEARYDLAVLLTRIGHEDKAVSLYEENMRRGWHLPTAINLSAEYLRLGKRRKAIELLEAAARKFPAEAVPWYMLASIAERQGDKEKADLDYRKALKADPANGFAHIRYARFLAATGRLDQASEHAARAIKLLPTCAVCHRIAGDVFRKSGRLKQALAAYQKAAALAPDLSIRRRIIAVLDALGEHERAAVMRRALRGMARQ